MVGVCGRVEGFVGDGIAGESEQEKRERGVSVAQRGERRKRVMGCYEYLWTDVRGRDRR